MRFPTRKRSNAPRTARHARTAGVLALAAVAGLAGGCEVTSFLDPSELPGYPKRPLLVNIVDNLGITDESGSNIEGNVGDFSQATDVEPRDLVAEQTDYKVSPNDLVQVSVTGLQAPQQESQIVRRVSASGNLGLPLIPSIKAVGKTEDELKEAIISAYDDANIIRREAAQVSVTVVERRGTAFSILGSVQAQGQYQLLDSNFRLLDALVLARGETYPVGINTVYIIRDVKQDPPRGASTAQSDTEQGAPTSPTERLDGGNRGRGPSGILGAPGGGVAPGGRGAPGAGGPGGGGGGPGFDPLVPRGDAGRKSDGTELAAGPKLPAREPYREPYREPFYAPQDPGQSGGGGTNNLQMAQADDAQPAGRLPGDTGGRIITPADMPAMAPDANPGAAGQNEPVKSPVVNEPQPAPDGTVSTAPAYGPGLREGKGLDEYNPDALATAPASKPDFKFNAPDEPTDKRVIKVPLVKLKAGELKYNVVIRPGDIIVVPQPIIGEYYMGGHVARTGVYSLTGRDITLKQAIISAGMLDPVAIPQRTRIVRRIGQNQEVIARVDLKKIFAGTEPDLFIKPNDQVMVGTNFFAPFVASFRNAFRITYGFGFLYDRNFSDSRNLRF